MTSCRKRTKRFTFYSVDENRKIRFLKATPELELCSPFRLDVRERFVQMQKLKKRPKNCILSSRVKSFASSGHDFGKSDACEAKIANYPGTFFSAHWQSTSFISVVFSSFVSANGFRNSVHVPFPDLIRIVFSSQSPLANKYGLESNRKI